MTIFKLGRTLGLGAAVALGTMAFTAPASAQGAKQGWYKLCSKQAANEICNVQFNITGNNGRPVASVNLLRIKGKVNQEVFQIAVPSARFITAGIKMRIDNGRENTIPYSVCMPQRCLAETRLTPPLVSALKKGGKIKLVTTNFQRQKNPLEVTLSGFTKAFEGPALKRDEYASRKSQLQKELAAKAAETRKKLLEAQKKAKAGG